MSPLRVLGVPPRHMIDYYHHLWAAATRLTPGHPRQRPDRGGSVSMPRASRAQMELHRQTVLHAASKMVRERGVDGVTVPEVMAAAGLTHGGFYRHFES